MKKEKNETYYQDSIVLLENTPHEKKQAAEIKKQMFEAAKMFETNIIELKQKKIGFLTKVAVFQGIAIVLLTVAIAGLTPLKTVVPMMLRVDTTTGYVDKINPYNGENSTMDSNVVRYFVARFIENREGYEWFTIQNMSNFVESTANKAVLTSYKGYMLSDYSPLKRLSKNLKMLVKVNGITFLDDETAQVRFTKLITEPDEKLAVGYEPTKWIATLKFDFTKTIKTEAQRLINPLGFNVVSYRVDAEVVK
ncbi:virB8 family protein [Arsenophonus nasoniae]|uniref:Type IV secretion system protein n=2 Tax=Arsenophonus nasoniae TaxID=638 RepID=A0AA95GWI0_9GAMM|nr:type IV secretion system protein [Arsenophonus nasoniae]WGM03975.1 type IV secretion system protein [Arsenophonus nasoniae]WGM09130.1 type IV secretion system protein [Arsenophonus nasoniae]